MTDPVSRRSLLFGVVAATATTLALAGRASADGAATADRTPQPTGAPGTPTSATTSPSPSPSESPELYLVFTRTGGFAGVNDRAVVTKSGLITVTHRNGSRMQWQLPAVDLRTLRRVAVGMDIHHLKPCYDDPRVADAFVYTVVFDGDTVQALQTVVPPSMAPLVTVMTNHLDVAPSTLTPVPQRS